MPLQQILSRTATILAAIIAGEIETSDRREILGLAYKLESISGCDAVADFFYAVAIEGTMNQLTAQVMQSKVQVKLDIVDLTMACAA